jgi:predicted phosphoadenosine phosphosulfate sulfurtransferase
MNVYEGAERRIRFVFSEFERISVSISGGKDSTCLYHLALAEAERRGRKIEVFFLDQEAEYQSSVDLIAKMMRHPLVEPRWYQVQIQMTNATSHREVFLNAWYPGEQWVRSKDPLAIHGIEADYPRRFYKFFPWYEAQDAAPTAHLVGLRIFESMNRQRTMLKANGYKHYKWSTACASEGSYRFYPIFDWQFRDVWKYIYDSGVEYNRLYDRMYARTGTNMRTMRVSNLIHEQAFRSLAQLQELEPETYDRLVQRLGGVHCAALYANESGMFAVEELPRGFASWRDFRDHLMASTPDLHQRYAKRFAHQDDGDEAVCRHQVKQLLLNDWEGKLPNTRNTEARLRKLWWEVL